MRTTVIGLLLVISAPIVAKDPKPPVLTPEERKLAVEAKKLEDEAFRAYQAEQFSEAVAKLVESLAIKQKLYPAANYPNGHAQLASSLHNLGLVLHSMQRSDQAVPHLRNALAMDRKLYPPAEHPDGHRQIAIDLNNLGAVLHAMGQAEQALPHLHEAVAMRQKLYPPARFPDGHELLATSLNNLGDALVDIGQAGQSLPYHRDALAMRRKLYPPARFPNGHEELASSLNNLGAALRELGRTEQALPYFRDALAMVRKLYPDGHRHLATGLSSLGYLLEQMGQMEEALSHSRDALAMFRKLYPTAKFPDGHFDLARSVNNLGSVLQSMGQKDQALTHYREALAMNQRLYPASTFPNGHPHLAVNLNNLGTLLEEMDRAEEALEHGRDAVAMLRKLYPATKFPNGHPELAGTLSSLSATVGGMGGRAAEALTHSRDALAMLHKLFPTAKFPDGHALLMRGLFNVGAALERMGRAEQALTHFRDALAMDQRLLRRELTTASEEAAFDKIRAEPLPRDAYLSVTATLTPPADVVAALWPGRALVTRLLEQRHANAQAASTAAGPKLDELRGVRRRIDQLLQDSTRNKDDRDKLLTEYADKSDRLERDLVAAIPALKRWQELDRLGPADLAKALPPGAVFIDIIQHAHVTYVDKTPRTHRYVAFVLARDGSIRRVELEKAQPIDQAVRKWRSATESRRDEALAAADLKKLVWDKLVAALPAGTTTLYLAADGDLARLPWAALPIGKDRVLLEDYMLAQVPHGVFLLDQLKFGKPTQGSASLLTLGGVDYGTGIWPALPGTAIEAKAIAALAPGDHVALVGREATAEKLLAGLSQAQYVHLATHGEFQAEALSKERQRAAEAVKSRLLGDDTRKVAAKNPLGYVGLVLADGKILSGLGIVDLPLKNTHLVTLSACETGLGEYTGGEGVQGLQRAFHLAGCPNVIASLWKVNDAATAALMAKFYHELWVNKKPPIEALREAQLMIYYHPESIPVLAKADRSAPDFKKAIEVEAKPEKSPTTNTRTDTKLWAAFMLSGVGK